MAACVCCEIADELEPLGRLHRAGEHWTCNVRLHHRRPALVVQTRVHRESLHELSREELRSMGPVLEAASDAVRANGTVERVYVAMYNEGRPGHVHFHVVPRFAEDVDGIGPDLPDVLPPGARLDIEGAASAVAAGVGSRRQEPSALVRGVRRVAQGWNRHASAYRWARPLGAFDKGETYVLSWLLLWTVLATTASILGANGVLAVLIGLGGLYRSCDMGLYEVEILLTMERSTLRSIPRGLVLRACNLVEVLLGCTAFFAAVPGPPNGRSTLLRGFETVTLQPTFGYPGVATDIAVVVSLALTLLVVTGGVAMLVGKVAETFEEE